MKKIILSVAAVMSMASVSSAGDDIGEALKAGKFSVDAQLFYYNRQYNTGVKSSEALTLGGIMKYVSADYNNFKVGTALFTNNLIADVTSRDRVHGSSQLDNVGDGNINFVGEAYLEYKNGKTMVKIGRQRFKQPILNDWPNRTLPTSYEAIRVENKDIANTTLEVGFVNSDTGFGSRENEFEQREDIYGDDGLGYIYVTNKSVKGLKLRAQYVKALSDEHKSGATTTKIVYSDFRYADFKYSLPYGKKTYITGQYLGNTYEDQDDSMTLGAKAGTTVGMFDLAAIYVQVFDNKHEKIGSNKTFSFTQQGYDMKPSTAVGGYIVAKPIKNLSIKALYLDVSADDYGSNAGAALSNKKSNDEFKQTAFDVKYAINSWSSLRIRYSDQDYSKWGESKGKIDSTDFRTIYRIKF